MTGVVRDGRTKFARPGLLRSLRETLARLQRVDLDELAQRIDDADTALREIRGAQRELREISLALAARNVSPPLVSPLELAGADRYALEDRCRALTNPVYVGDHTALCRMLGQHKIYLDTRDTGFAAHVLLDGFWEMWLTIFLAGQVQPGMTIIDVGANFGYYTLLFGSLVGANGRVYAVEPNPEVAARLRRSVELNGLASRTTIIEAAAGAVEGGEVALFVPDGEPKNATIRFAPSAVTPGAGKVHQVQRVTADRFAAGSARVDLVKIDAEGAEEAVIAGMMTILRRDRPGLVLEFNADRYIDPGGFLDRLTAIYARMRYIDVDCRASPVTREELVRDRWGEDWMLYFDQPAPATDPAPPG